MSRGEQKRLIMFNGSRTQGLTGSGTDPSGPGYPESLTTSDLDDDGHPDVVVTIEGDGHQVLYGQRGGLSSHKP
ncbi:hypothetical protein [Streptomyces sp. NPDC056982]|uniref:hypothetical protein n=1 Tax=unclassified Streptomyces TaxID=2593676 RepID=UPI00363258D3